jgi:hypothetical protein
MKKLKKFILSIITIALLFSIVGLNGNRVKAAETPSSITTQANQMIQSVGFEAVALTEMGNFSMDGALKFATVKEFNQHLVQESMKSSTIELVPEITDESSTTQPGNPIIIGPVKPPVEYSSVSPNLYTAAAMTTYSTKTYKVREWTGVSAISSYARVSRTNGIVKSVNVWSEQTGVTFPITWRQSTAYHSLNSAKTGGKAYVKGTKLTGANVGGQAIGYSRSVTYVVSF